MLDPCDNGEGRSFVRTIEPRSSVAEPATKKGNNDENQNLERGKGNRKGDKRQTLDINKLDRAEYVTFRIASARRP